MKSKLAEAAGWYGIIAILGAYGLVSFGVLSAESIIFQLLNATGALGVIWISSRKGVTQSVLLNAIWVAIAVLAIVKILL